MQMQYWKNNGAGLLTIGGFLLAVGLLSSVIPNIDLLSPASSSTGAILTYLTYSAGSQGFLITLAFFVAITAFRTTNKKQLFLLMTQLGVLLVLSFAAKTAMKEITKSPRPYTETLTQLHLVDSPSSFYELDLPTQNSVIESASQKVSHWRTIHWQGETDYSFPSGHTVFVALCVFFFGGLFLKRKQYLMLGIVFTWGLAVGFSRLWLGMHRPEDLIGSSIVVAIIAALIPAPNQADHHSN
ncbi:phosphatase PAP2 family protein [Vibrio comitans]|uniref:undecaprenyl-diphosphate phosphatase n=1 Tax=Vibrio comitans NBRC 102076 TaxID=1219078 RepID=A0A4Y3IIX6_9VIBR|nr:phosphatase PAP2 family protein [Vibrio comitans]GEA59453.1 phosphatidylglycerophosphatase B [Vibrio comitans NBRC 102076]